MKLVAYKPNFLTKISALLIVIISIVFTHTPIAQQLENTYLDVLFYFKGDIKKPDDVIIVGIDEASFSELGLQWPWPRELHAELIDSLYSHGAVSVAIDILFSEASTVHGDKALSDSVNRHDGAFLAMNFDAVNEDNYIQTTFLKPANTLNIDDSRLGFINISTERDGFVRRSLLINEGIKSLALSAAIFADNNCCENVIFEEYNIINYVGPPRTIKTISYYQALNAEKYLPSDVFKNKIVFIGLSTQGNINLEGSQDRLPNPYTRWGYGYMSGVEIHANIAHNILNNDFIKDWSGKFISIISVILSLSVAILFLYLTTFISTVILFSIGFTVAPLSVYLFYSDLVYMPVSEIILPVLVAYIIGVASHYYNTHKEKRFIQTAFGTYLSPNVVSELISNPEGLRPGGKNVDASVMFLDIAGFTTMSEQFDAETVVKIMNNCLGAITDIVLKHDGMIDKFIGDAVMAVWGAPVEQKDHAVQACAAAIEIQEMLITLAEEEKNRTGAVLAARIGVNSGNMVAGNIGGSKRFDYTVQGNEVNVASRLEGVNKYYGTKIMVGEYTWELAKDDFTFRLIDKVRLKGKKIPINIVEPLDQDDKALLMCSDCFKDGLIHYHNQQWDEAIVCFNNGLDYKPDDGPCKVFISRCEEYKSTPPDEDWDGVYDMTSK